MNTKIEEILAESAAYGMRNDVISLAMNLSNVYKNFMKTNFPSNAISENSESFYELAYDLLLGEEDESNEFTEHDHDSNIKPYGNELNLYCGPEEYLERLDFVATEISMKDESMNWKQAQTGKPLFENVFILTDVWSMFTYYELCISMNLYDSPRLIIAPDLITNLPEIPAGSNIYVLSYHRTDKSIGIINELLKFGIHPSDITSIEVLGQHTMTPCQTIPLIAITDNNILIDCYGLGKPTKDGKYSETLGIYY